MTRIADIYPPSPDDVPPDLARPSSGYRLRVLIVLGSLFLFVALYFGLIIGSAYACWWCFSSLGSGGDRATTEGSAAQMGSTVRLSNDLLGVYEGAAQRWQRRELDDAGFVQVIESDILPPWRLARKQLLAANLPKAADHWRDVTARYMKAREGSWDLLCRSLRQKDQALLEKAKQKMTEADALAQQTHRIAPIVVPRPRNSGGHEFWFIIGGILSGLLCVFLIKGFFKRRPPDLALRIEVTEEEQPVLFEFIRRLCKDTRAPLPRRVYVSPEVNAAVFYPQTFLSLFLPARKNLLIGLGLVNQLNLSEFKAVLAHEFGHFSQSSMKLGGYVYSSNRIICELVYGRDWLDTLLAYAGSIDIRISIFVWAFAGVLWVLRKTLQGIFRVINFANSALSRQMEFNADLVAVSVTGSDALIHALSRLDFANEALMCAYNDLRAAGDHKLFSRDAFYHQTKAADYLREFRKDPNLGKPPELPRDPHETVQVFSPEDVSVPKMWATHPTNYDREVNAKNTYIRSHIDERSPWALFTNPSAVREEVTQAIYSSNKELQDIELQDPKVVQAFIDEEHAEMTYPAHYHGMYDNRYLKMGGFDELAAQAPAAFADKRQLSQAHSRLYSDELKSRMKRHMERQKEFNLLAGVTQGAVELTGKDFQFRGQRFPAAKAKDLLADVDKELNEDVEWLGKLDRQVFQVYYQMSRQVGEEFRRELEERYRFHLGLQEVHDQLAAQQQQVNAVFAFFASTPQPNQAQFQECVGIFQNAHHTLSEKLKAADNLYLPALKNMTTGEPLGPFLLNKDIVRPLPMGATSIDGKWISEFTAQMGEVLDKSHRMHFKSLGGLLALQEKIAIHWSLQHAGDG